jgi:uncharacterized protein YjbJ (UPF0337 family)
VNWDKTEGAWKILEGKIRERWGKLTDDDLESVLGKKEQLEGRIQKVYGIAHDEARRQVEEFEKGL